MESQSLIGTIKPIGKSDEKSSALENTKGFYASRTRRLKIVSTVFLVICSLSMGLYTEIIGPTIPDIMDQLGITYEELGLALDVKSVGYLLSAIIGGTFAHRYPLHFEVVVFMSFLFGTVGTAILPWSRDIWVLALALHSQGWGRGLFDVGTDSMLLSLWGNEAAIPLYLRNFASSIGSLVAPQLARPYLSDRYRIYKFISTLHNNRSSSKEIFMANESLNLMKNSTEYNRADLTVPYTICAAYSDIFVFVFLALYIYNNSERKKFQTIIDGIEDQNQTNSSLSENSSEFFSFFTKSNRCYTITFFLFFLFFILHICGIERAFGRFIYSFAVEKPNPFSIEEATILNTLFWAGITVGRGLAAPLSYFLSSFAFLNIQLFISVASAVVLVVWGLHSSIILRIFTVILSMGISSMYPAAIAYANVYLKIEGLAITFIIAAASIGAFVYQSLMGYLFQVIGPISLMFIALGYSISASVTFVGIIFFSYSLPKRFDEVGQQVK